MNTTHTEHCIDVCNNLLRCEISAVETYTEAIERFRGEPEVAVLADIRRDHVRSADLLRDSIQDMGGIPTDGADAWDTWARTVDKATKLMGDAVALRALREAEEHGEREYKEALAHDDVLPACKELIRAELLPRQLTHISSLHGLENSG